MDVKTKTFFFDHTDSEETIDKKVDSWIEKVEKSGHFVSPSTPGVSEFNEKLVYVFMYAKK